MLTDLVPSPVPARSAAIQTPSPYADERELVARAREGDLVAFEALYNASVGRVFALCLRLTADRATATELTQDVFVHAWEHLSAFRGEAAFTSWLHRIAVNALLMRRRAEKRRAARVVGASDAPEPTEGAEDDADDVLAGSIPPIDVGQSIDLERAIAALPRGARQVFVLHDIVGYRHDEIAQMTGLAQGTLRAQLHRARRLLMEALKP